MPGIIVNYCGEKSLESDVVLPSSKMDIVCGFHILYIERLYCSDRCHWLSKTVMKVQFSQLFCQLETFGFLCHSHCSVSPQV